MKKLFSLLLFQFILFSNCYLFAQWEQTGPFGGRVNNLVIKGDKIFAGTQYGVFVSSLKDTSWKEVNNQDIFDNILSIATKGENIFVGTYYGLFRSENDGKTWQQIISHIEVVSIVVEGKNIFVGSGYNGVFRSSDDGNQWVNISNGLASLRITSLAVNKNILLAGTEQKGLFCSNDNGKHWKAMNGWVDLDKRHGYEIEVNAAAVKDSIVIVSTNVEGISISNDNGVTWHQSNSRFGGSVKYFKVYGDSIFAILDWGNGIYLSDDNGNNWSKFEIKGYKIYDLLIKDNVNYAGTNKGAILSTNNGANWIPFNKGLANIYIRKLYVSGNTIYTLGHGRVFYTKNLGATWEMLLNKNINLYSIATKGDSIFIGGDCGNLFSSFDKGFNWESTNVDVTSSCNFPIEEIAVNQNYLFVISNSWGVKRLSLSNSQLEKINGFGFFSIKTNGNKILLGSHDGVFVSSDNGTSWKQLNKGIENKLVYPIVVDNENIFAGTWGNGVFKSSDNGTNWYPANHGLDSVNITSLAIYDNYLFAGTNKNGIYISGNNGDSWTRINLGLRGIGNDGNSFGDENSLINVNDIVVKDDYVFISFGAGWWWNHRDVNGASGVWRRSISDIITSVEKKEDNLPTTFFLSQNYPNPFNPTTTIKYSIPVVDANFASTTKGNENIRSVQIKVYDVLGKEVATLVNEKKPAGNYEVMFDGSNLTSGIYFYCLTSGDFRQTKKLILLK